MPAVTHVAADAAVGVVRLDVDAGVATARVAEQRIATAAAAGNLAGQRGAALAGIVARPGLALLVVVTPPGSFAGLDRRRAHQRENRDHHRDGCQDTSFHGPLLLTEET